MKSHGNRTYLYWKKTETRREWKQNQRLLEFNKNKYTAYTYVYRLNVVFRGKLIALSIYIKNGDISYETLNSTCGRSRTKEVKTHVRGREQEIIKQKVQINNLEIKRIIQRINEKKSWSMRKSRK